MATLHLCHFNLLFHNPNPLPFKPIISHIPPILSNSKPKPLSANHTTLLVDSFHHNLSLKDLIGKIRSKDSDPLQVLKDEGDWNKQHFWAVMKYLKETSRLKEGLQVFYYWKSIEKSRINELNYSKVIELLCAVGLMGEALSLLQEMSAYGLSPSGEIFNSIIHGFAKKGQFEEAKLFLTKMVENDLVPESETYDGLIRAYGDYKMYDEMCKCVKKMELDGCHIDHVTYNILIRVFAQGGLLEKMEVIYRTVISKCMSLQSSTLIAMLEAYADFGVLEKMEIFYYKILNSDTYLSENLIRKMARVYIENYRFSRLEDLGLKTASKTGRSNLVWHLLLLSNACLSSRIGMESVLREMEAAKIKPDTTCINIVALAYLKMKNSRHLEILLSQLQLREIKPDIVTVGVAYDASRNQLVRNRALEVWQRKGFLNEKAELNTDPIVFTAFGKGFFLKSCEELYTVLESKPRKKVWTYNDLIDLVSNQRRKPPLRAS